jgi:hypothetical protein
MWEWFMGIIGGLGVIISPLMRVGGEAFKHLSSKTKLELHYGYFTPYVEEVEGAGGFDKPKVAKYIRLRVRTVRFKVQ